jgi:glutamate-ammonia-ligase adenylyltransferase
MTARSTDHQGAAVNALAQGSRWVQRTRRRYENLLAFLPDGSPTHTTIEATIDALSAQNVPLGKALRISRALVLERLAVLDIEAQTDLETITHGMTALAEVVLERALIAARHELDTRYGPPCNPQGGIIDFWIVGMGKLGARELNVSSDIDLIYLYEEEGQTTGNEHGIGVISAHEYFAQLARRLQTLIGDATEDGFVFRMDLALRPNGNSGPPAVSLAMLETYFMVQGREWERFAWLKSRVVVPQNAVRSGRALPLRELVTPFVYRRYLDYNVFESLRQLHRKVREEAQRSASGRPERANDVKLSRGGIREIEFTVQLLQVVRGGQFPELRTRSTLRALHRLAANDVMKESTAQRLSAAYIFLRRVEHRIQYLDDQQTHRLPTDANDLQWIAQSLEKNAPDDAISSLMQALCLHREAVAEEFDLLLHEGRSRRNDESNDDSCHSDGVAAASNKCRNCTPAQPQALVDTPAFIEKLPQPLHARVSHFAQSARVKALRDDAKLRLAQLIARAANEKVPTSPQESTAFTAALRFIDWLEPLMRRESYIALLAERPETQKRLLRLLGTARWPMHYLMQHPGVIDELADERLRHERFDRQALAHDLQSRYHGWVRSGQADEEALLDTLRRAHQAEVFRTLVRDIEGELTVEEVADDLSALADVLLECTLDWAWKNLRQGHRETPKFAIIGYGKLGGKELGYGGDLDLVFLFDDDDDRAPEIYARFARKLITWLTLRTAAGGLFDIDTALRPNGGSGLLVTSMDAFKYYQSQRGSNTAWTWEHQAITRARWCAGDSQIHHRFEATRRAVLCSPRDDAALRAEIALMREKIKQSNSIKTNFFDIKHSPGGMVDVEFVVQYLVLKYSAAYPDLQSNLGNIALLQHAQAHGLLQNDMGQDAAIAYRALRHAQHRARLNEASLQLSETSPLYDDLIPHRNAVLALWKSIFGFFE